VADRTGPGRNVVAGFHHDHLFVPHERAADAVALWEQLAERSGQ